VIITLARLQGTGEALPGPASTEEEPGKIHHEHRTLYVGARRISPASQRSLETLSGRWGGDGKSVTYYGSADATPLYARLLSAYCDVYGPSILDDSLVNKDGTTITVQDSLTAALGWLTARVELSTLGLVEFQRRNVPHGIPFQVWKDSGTSYVHRDGTIANYDGPIAAVEVQGYAYDALIGAARLYASARPTDAGEWRDAAQATRERLLQHMWMPHEEYFAMGIDRSTTGSPGLIDCVASNGALLLNTGLFEDLSEEERNRYVGGIVRRICGPEFVTDVGIRCRSLVDDGLVDFQDYHGSWAVWAKEGYDIAKGLLRQGMPRLAHQLFARLLNGTNVAGEHVEFLYVSPDQRVHYDFRGKDVRPTTPTEIIGTNLPEAPQAWSVSAMLAIKAWSGLVHEAQRGASQPPSAVPRWARALEDELVSQMPAVAPLRNATECEAAFARRGDFVLNRALGVERDRAAQARRRGVSG
jgi:glycogen debranching enzyme